MSSVVQICNMALSHIGSEARVLSISPPDGSVEAGYCSTFYDAARTELLEPGTWRFSLTRVKLAQTNNLSTTWAYAYALPSTCMRPVRVLRAGAGLTVFNQDQASVFQPNDDDSAPFTVEGDVVYTNEPEAVLVFVHDVTDTAKFTPSFKSTLSYLLASYLAGPIVKGVEGLRLGDAMRERAMALADIAAAASANASAVYNEPNPTILAARA